MLEKQMQMQMQMDENKMRIKFISNSLKLIRSQEQILDIDYEENVNINSERNAIQQLLDMENQYEKQFKNPENDFMNLTKNIRINTHRGAVFRKSPQIFVHQKQPQKIIHKKKTSQKKLMPIFVSKQYKKQTVSNSNLQRILGSIFTETKSNLLSPKQEILPPIFDIDKNYSVLKKRKSTTKSTHIPRSSSSIQSQLNLFPSLQKQIRKRKLLGYS